METTAIEDRFQQRGIRPTAMRLLVYRELERCHSPQSLRDLEDRMVTADRSTIFRTLTLLLQHHLIHAIEDGSGALKYEICHGHDECTIDDQHTHFYCEVCEHTYCLHNTPIPQVELPGGFHIHTINYLIKGVCPNCAEKHKH